MIRNARGFTLLEMMVVVTIALTMMLMIVPIFNVTTKTVQNVERKLAVYEAARNILDIIEADIRMGVANERGGHWSIKTVAWEDNDPFTPAGSAQDPGVGDAGSVAYRQSRRYGCALNYVRLEAAGLQWSDTGQFPGGKRFPLVYTASDNNFPEGWRCSMRSSLLYQTCRESYSSDYEYSTTGDRWNRNEQLADVGTIEASFNYRSVDHQFRYYNDGVSGYGTRHYDRVYDLLGPGKEIKVPPGFSGDQGSQQQRRIQGIRILDLEFAYWDDVAKQFVDPPLNTAIYFWPPPKAVRVTVTVCDRDKRSLLTLCRVVQVPVGLGNGVVQDTRDAFYEAPNATFNRTKYLPNLPVIYDGDTTVPWGGDWDITETKLLTNYKKPIGWP